MSSLQETDILVQKSETLHLIDSDDDEKFDVKQNVAEKLDYEVDRKGIVLSIYFILWYLANGLFTIFIQGHSDEKYVVPSMLFICANTAIYLFMHINHKFKFSNDLLSAPFNCIIVTCSMCRNIYKYKDLRNAAFFESLFMRRLFGGLLINMYQSGIIFLFSIQHHILGYLFVVYSIAEGITLLFDMYVAEGRIDIDLRERYRRLQQKST